MWGNMKYILSVDQWCMMFDIVLLTVYKQLALLPPQYTVNKIDVWPWNTVEFILPPQQYKLYSGPY